MGNQTGAPRRGPAAAAASRRRHQQGKMFGSVAPSMGFGGFGMLDLRVKEALSACQLEKYEPAFRAGRFLYEDLPSLIRDIDDQLSWLVPDADDQARLRDYVTRTFGAEELVGEGPEDQQDTEDGDIDLASIGLIDPTRITFAGEEEGEDQKKKSKTASIAYGAYGAVKRAVLSLGLAEINVVVAELERQPGDNVDREMWKKSFVSEIRRMYGRRDAKHVVKFLGWWFVENEDDETETKACLCLEECELGDLMQWRSGPEWDRRVGPADRVAVIVQIAEALQHLQENGFAHTTLCMENVLLNADGSVRLVDLGLPQLQSTKSLTLDLQSPEYISPEFFHGNESLNLSKVDIYALGILIYMFWTGEQPYEEALSGRGESERRIRNAYKVLLEIHGSHADPKQDPLRPNTNRLVQYSCPTALIELATRCWDKDPSLRPSYDEIITELKSMSMDVSSFRTGGSVSSSKKSSPTLVTPVPMQPGTITFDPSRIVEWGGVLNSGSYGVIRTAMMTVSPSDSRTVEVAVKELNIKGSQMDEIIREVDFLRELNHECVLQCYGFFVTGSKANMVLELCMEGDLFDGKTEMDLLRKIEILINTARGMSYLHQAGVVHRDLKPQNVLIVGNSVRICDFGTARHMASIGQTLVGTVEYLAPEQYLIDPVDREKSYLIDIYAFGIMLWEIFTEQQPFLPLRRRCRNNQFELLRMIHEASLRPPLRLLPDGIPESYKTLMKNCWRRRPFLRPQSYDEVIAVLVEEYRKMPGHDEDLVAKVDEELKKKEGDDDDGED